MPTYVPPGASTADFEFKAPGTYTAPAPGVATFEFVTPLDGDKTVSIVGTLPGLTGPVRVVQGQYATIVGALPGLTGSVAVIYVSDTARPLVAKIDAVEQVALPQPAGAEMQWVDATASPKVYPIRYQKARPRPRGWAMVGQNALSRGLGTDVRFQDALARHASGTLGYQESVPKSLKRVVRYQDASPLHAARADIAFQQGIPAWNGRDVAFQQGVPVGLGAEVEFANGIPIVVLRYSRYQDGYSVLAGASEHPVVDPTDPEPPEPHETIIVPVKEVYVVLNTSSLYRVDGNVFLPTYAMSMSLDVDSWTWSFSASMPRSCYDAVKHDSDGTPVEVECLVNGVAYRFRVQKIARDRGFAEDGISITGRGLSDELAEPNAPTMNFGNAGDRTAQQLMADVLTDNGVPMDWEVDWQLTDWLVPGGSWTKTGTYIDALNEIAAAAGGYIQPVPSDRTLRVLPRMPLMPRDWATDALIDYDLPDAIAVRESTEWVEKPRYNRVYVQGQRNGIRGRVTLTGSAGDIGAPTVVDSLITHADAARQRGTAILGDTGRIATIGLSTAVGIKDTHGDPIGIIPPGKFVKYTENGVPKIGITRSVNVQIGMPEINQTIGVEFHESV